MVKCITGTGNFDTFLILNLFHHIFSLGVSWRS